MFEALISAGASLLGGAMGADAAEDAAAVQAAATDRANERIERQYQQTREDLAPYRNAGSAAINALTARLGLGGGASMSAATGGLPTYQGLRAELLPQYTSRGRELVYLNGSDGGQYQDYRDADVVDEAALSAAIEQRIAQARAAQEAQAAQQATAAQGDPSYGELLRPFTGANLEQEPGYQFGLNQGLGALNNTLASRRMLNSGAAMKAATRFATDYAGTKYGDAFNRDMAGKQFRYNALTGVVGTGQNAAAMTGNAGQNMVNAVGANTTAMGNAQGAARIAGGNSWQNAIQGGLDSYYNNQLLQRITGGPTGMSGSRARGYTVPTYDGAEY